MTDNVIRMPEPIEKIGQRIDTAYARTQRGQQEWIEGTLDLAQALAEGRSRYPSDNEFGAWLGKNGHDHVNHQDRAALIRMAENLPLARIILEETERRSWRHIWSNEMQTRFTHVGKPPEKSHDLPETDPAASTAAMEPLSTVPQGDQKQDSHPPPRHAIRTSGKEMKNPGNAGLIKVLGITVEQFTTVMSAYPYNRQRIFKTEFANLARMKKIGGIPVAKAMFERACMVVETGRAPTLSNRDSFDARIIVPDMPEGFSKLLDLPKMAQRIERLDLLNSKAAELTAAAAPPFDIHNELHHIWESGTIRPPPIVKPIALSLDDSKNQIKHQVKYCGEVIWPHDQLKHVTYKDLNMGWHIADHLLKYFEVAKPQKPNEVLVEVMQLVQDLRAASSLTGVTYTMMMCVQAYAKRNQRKDRADLSDGMPPGRPR